MCPVLAVEVWIKASAAGVGRQALTASTAKARFMLLADRHGFTIGMYTALHAPSGLVK